MKILITGATGFVGKHLTEYLLNKKKEATIFGTFINEREVEESDKLKLFKVDLSEGEQVENLVKEVRPDVVFHLAALSSAKDSFDKPTETLINNVSSEISILESIRKNNLKDTKILIISSAEIYGLVEKKNLPINEDTPLNPTSPYAVSKITQDYLALQYFNSYKLKVIRVRPFNHVGPGQSPNFVVSAFASKIAKIEKGDMEPELLVGNLETKRDFTDVRDVVRAYDLLMEKGKIGDVYNIGSGKSYQISEVLNKLIALSKRKISVKNSPDLFRPADNPELVCDPGKIQKETGWVPEIPFDQTLKDTLDYWRNII